MNFEEWLYSNKERIRFINHLKKRLNYMQNKKDIENVRCIIKCLDRITLSRCNL